MEIGKLPEKVLEERILNHISFNHPRVLQRAGVGEDAAVIDFSDHYVSVSCDPITGATKNIGKLAVHINCNDIITSGAMPLAMINCLLLPPTITEEEIEKIICDMVEEGAKINVEIVGGHTEISDAVTRTVIISTVMGILPKEKFMDKKEIHPGDVIAMSKIAALEGTAILAHEREEELRAILTSEELFEAQSLLKDLSVVPEGMLALRHHVKYMHDVTEGGVVGALWELSRAVKKGIAINKEDIPVLSVTKKICHRFKVDEDKLISSGSMLFIFSEEDFVSFQGNARKEGISVTAIGRVRQDQKRILLDMDGTASPLKSPEVDHLYKALDQK